MSNISLHDNNSAAKKEKTIGVLGGLGPLSTEYLFKKIIELTPAKKDQDHLRVIIDSNPKIPDRTDSILNGSEEIVSRLVETARNLERAGADLILLPCNTAHHYLDEVQREIGTPILNMVKLTIDSIYDSNLSSKNIGLLATRGTLEAKIYQKNDVLLKTNWITLNDDEQDEMMEFIYKVKSKPQPIYLKKKIIKFLDILKRRRAEVIVLGCTELSLFKDIVEYEIKLIDPLEVLASEAIKLSKPEFVS